MQQRFAFALLIRLTRSPTSIGQSTQTRHGMVQATHAPVASRLLLLRQLKLWIENVLSHTFRHQRSRTSTSRISN